LGHDPDCAVLILRVGFTKKGGAWKLRDWACD